MVHRASHDQWKCSMSTICVYYLALLACICWSLQFEHLSEWRKVYHIRAVAIGPVGKVSTGPLFRAVPKINISKKNFSLVTKGENNIELHSNHLGVSFRIIRTIAEVITFIDVVALEFYPNS